MGGAAGHCDCLPFALQLPCLPALTTIVGRRCLPAAASRTRPSRSLTTCPSQQTPLPTRRRPQPSRRRRRRRQQQRWQQSSLVPRRWPLSRGWATGSATAARCTSCGTAASAARRRPAGVDGWACWDGAGREGSAQEVAQQQAWWPVVGCWQPKAVLLWPAAGWPATGLACAGSRLGRSRHCGLKQAHGSCSFQIS